MSVDLAGGRPPKRSKRRARTAGPTTGARRPSGGKGFGREADRVAMKKSDVRYGNKEGGGTHFGLEERFAWQKARYVSDAMYTMPAVKAPPFSFGTSTRADWSKIMENTRDLHNPNGELGVLSPCHRKPLRMPRNALDFSAACPWTL